MNVNEKGHIGLIETIRDLTLKGYECFTPIHDYSPIDLIVVDKMFNTFKLQVKYREEFRGIIEVRYSSVVNGKSIKCDLTAIDGWAVFCPQIQKVVYVSKNEVDLTKTSFAFRLNPGQKSVNKCKTQRKMFLEYGELAEWSKAAPC